MLTQYWVGTVAESFPQTEHKGQQNQTFSYEIVSREDCASYLLHNSCGNCDSKEGCHWYCCVETKAGAEVCTTQEKHKKENKTDQLHKVGNTEQLDGLNGKWFS